MKINSRSGTARFILVDKFIPSIYGKKRSGFGKRWRVLTDDVKREVLGCGVRGSTKPGIQEAELQQSKGLGEVLG